MRRPRREELSGPIERMLMVLAAALCVYAGWTWASRGVVEAGVDEGLETRSPDEGKAEAPPRIASALKAIHERNMFSPPKPEGFQGQVVGILGDRAFFSNQQSAAVGDSVMGAEVLAIGPDWVEIEFEGARRRLPVFSEHGGGGGGNAGRPMMRGERGSGMRGGARWMRRGASGDESEGSEETGDGGDRASRWRRMRDRE